MHNRYDILNNAWVASHLRPFRFSTQQQPLWVVALISWAVRLDLSTVRYVYDLGSESWIAGPNTNLPHALAAAVAVNGRLFIIGGSDGSIH